MKQLVKRTYLKAGRRKIENREDIDVVMENIIPSCNGTSASVNACARVAVDLKLVLNTWFGDLYLGDVFDAMMWFDPML